MERLIDSAPLVVGAGAVEAYVVNVKRLEVFMEVLKERRSFKEVGS